MSNGNKLPKSCSDESQPKMFTHRTGPSDSSSSLTVENSKRLEEEYLASEETIKMQRVQDYIEQTNLALFKKKTTRRCSICDAELEGASSSPLVKQKNIAAEVPGRPLKTGEISTAPVTYSPPVQPTGSVPKKSSIQVGSRTSFDSLISINLHNTTLHTTDTDAATRIYTSRRQLTDASDLPHREEAEKRN